MGGGGQGSRTYLDHGQSIEACMHVDAHGTYDLFAGGVVYTSGGSALIMVSLLESSTSGVTATLQTYSCHVFLFMCFSRLNKRHFLFFGSLR